MESSRPLRHELVQTSGRRLDELEAVITRGLHTFVEVGSALLAIRDGRLYRESGYGDFDSYCRERWNWRRARADQMIRAAETVKAIDTTVSTAPTNEAQARELARLPEPDQVREAWQEVREHHGTQITAARVRGVVDRRLGRRASSSPASVVECGEIDRSDDRSRLLEQYATHRQAAWGLAQLDPTAVAEALDATGRSRALAYVEEMVRWFDAFEAALRNPASDGDREDDKVMTWTR